MNEEEIIKRYQVLHKAYIGCNDFRILIGATEDDGNTFWRTKYRLIRGKISEYLKEHDMYLDNSKFLPTDLVLKFLENKNLSKQIEKDYELLINAKKGN